MGNFSAFETRVREIQDRADGRSIPHKTSTAARRTDITMTNPMKVYLNFLSKDDGAGYELGMRMLYGKPEEGIWRSGDTYQSAPNPVLWGYWTMLGLAYIDLQQYKEAAAAFDKATQYPNARFLPFAYAAATLGQVGRIDEARSLLAEAKRRNPVVSIDTVRNTLGRLDPNSVVGWIVDGLRKAGLSEE